jgi:hypothetical protein
VLSGVHLEDRETCIRVARCIEGICNKNDAAQAAFRAAGAEGKLIKAMAKHDKRDTKLFETAVALLVEAATSTLDGAWTVRWMDKDFDEEVTDDIIVTAGEFEFQGSTCALHSDDSHYELADGTKVTKVAEQPDGGIEWTTSHESPSVVYWDRRTAETKGAL